jgi:hypothetical protein
VEIRPRKGDIENEKTLILNRISLYKKKNQSAKNNYVSQERSGISVPKGTAAKHLT